MKVVLDTNVLISATLWEGSAAQKVVHHFIETDVEIFTTVEILTEMKKVLTMEFEYTKEKADYVIGKISFFLKLVEPKRKITAVEKDCDDDKILECAVEANAGYILSYDKHLLELKQFEGIKIVKPEEFL